MTALFGTSSPSYLILESLDLCNRHIAEDTPEAFELIAQLKQRLINAGFSLRESDPLRITVNTREYGFTGADFADALRDNNVECEYADENCTILLFSTITTRTETEAVQLAFSKIARKEKLPAVIYPVLKPERAMSIRSALFAPDEKCAVLPIGEALGKICAEITAPCPPCVPLVMPGEIIGKEEAGLLKSFGIHKIRITI
jgi:arginine/lysine/ornithine decarboxylase